VQITQYTIHTPPDIGTQDGEFGFLIDSGVVPGVLTKVNQPGGEIGFFLRLVSQVDGFFGFFISYFLIFCARRFFSGRPHPLTHFHSQSRSTSFFDEVSPPGCIPFNFLCLRFGTTIFNIGQNAR